MKKLILDELNRVDIDTFKSMKKSPFVVILDNIRSLHNVGSVFRTCDAFAASHLYLCGITAKPPHREINKTAIGATESVTWSHHADTKTLVEQLKTEGYQIFAAEQTNESIDIQNWKVPTDSPVAIIMGNEVDGVADELLPLINAAIEIPQIGTKHSLNVSVSCGVFLYEMWKQTGVK